MKTIFFFLAIATLSFSTVLGQSMGPNDPLPIDPTIKIGTLPNGMKYYIKKNSKPEKRVEFRLAVKTGSVMENDDQQGYAHFMEHMQFNGLKHFPKMDLVNFLESTGVRFGAHLNASTSFDQTVYMLQLPTDNPETVAKGLQVMGDWAGNATLDSDEIEKERGVVLEEWRLGRGAQERVGKIHLPREYAGSRYADRLPIGKPEIIEHGTQQALKDFYKAWYRPDLMAIFVVGDIDVDKMEKDVKAMFTPLKNPENEKERTNYTVNIRHDVTTSVAFDKELQGNSVQIVFQRPSEPEKTVADETADLSRHLFARMLSSRLQEIQRKADAPFIFAGANDSRDLGEMSEFGTFGLLKPESVRPGIVALLSEIIRVKQHGFTQSELDRQKKEVLSSYEQAYNERDKTESRQLINEYVRNFLRDEPISGASYEYEFAKKYLPTITLSSINALTKPLIENAGSVIMVSLKQKEGAPPPVMEPELRFLYDSVSRITLTAYEDKVIDKPLLARKPTPGKVTAERKDPTLDITEWTLSNGATVVIKPTDFKNDEVLFSAISPGGTSLASDAKVRSASIASSTVDQSGVGAFTATELEKVLAGKVANAGPTISSTSEGFYGNASPKDLETMFQLTYLYATEPRFDNDGYQTIIHQLEAGVDAKANSPEGIFSDTLSAVMTQYNPRVLPVTAEMIKALSINDAKAFYKDRYSDFSDFTFFIVGNVDLKTLKPMVETYLASLPSSSRKESWKDEGIRPPKGVVTKAVYKGIEPKSRVVITLSGPFSYTPKNRFLLGTMASVLGIKLRETLREEKGGVYGVGASAVPFHYPEERYTLTISFGCAPDRVNELVDAVMKKLDTMTMKAPEEIYMTKVKETEAKELEVNLKLNRYWLSALSSAYFNRESPRMILQRKDFISSLTAADILEAGKQYCKKTNMVKAVLYPEMMKVEPR